MSTYPHQLHQQHQLRQQQPYQYPPTASQPPPYQSPPTSSSTSSSRIVTQVTPNGSILEHSDSYYYEEMKPSYCSTISSAFWCVLLLTLGALGVGVGMFIRGLKDQNKCIQDYTLPDGGLPEYQDCRDHAWNEFLVAIGATSVFLLFCFISCCAFMDVLCFKPCRRHQQLIRVRKQSRTDLYNHINSQPANQPPVARQASYQEMSAIQIHPPVAPTNQSKLKSSEVRPTLADLLPAPTHQLSQPQPIVSEPVGEIEGVQQYTPFTNDAQSDHTNRSGRILNPPPNTLSSSSASPQPTTPNPPPMIAPSIPPRPTRVQPQSYVYTRQVEEGETQPASHDPSWARSVSILYSQQEMRK